MTPKWTKVEKLLAEKVGKCKVSVEKMKKMEFGGKKGKKKGGSGSFR